MNRSIARHSWQRSNESAVRIWALASSQYPIVNGSEIQKLSEIQVIDSLTELATHGRRALDGYNIRENIYLNQSRWIWKPTTGNAKAGELRDAFNRIIHAIELTVGYESLPSNVSNFNTGSIVCPYILAKTDRKELSFIDLFSMSHAWLFQAAILIMKNDAQQGDAPEPASPAR